MSRSQEPAGPAACWGNVGKAWQEKVSTCRLLTPVVQVTEDAFFAIFAFPLRSLRLKALVFERWKYEKLVTAKFAKNGRQERKERLSTSGDLDPTRMSRSQEPAWTAACWGNVGKAW